ncbi:MAG: PE family protein, partial [Actinomycetota bacterium]|nr:PE family protein [Actinomycetota bacterium]
MTLRVMPEGLTAASAAVEALTARMAAAHAAAAPTISAVVPPAADPVSLQTAADPGTAQFLHPLSGRRLLFGRPGAEPGRGLQ